MPNSEIQKPVTALAEEAAGDFASGHAAQAGEYASGLAQSAFTRAALSASTTNQDDPELTAATTSLYDYVTASTFSEISTSIGMEAKAAILKVMADKYGEFNKSNGGGRIEEVNGIKKGKDGKFEDEEDELEQISEAVGKISQPMSQARWETTSFNYAGMDLTGAEIDSISSMLQDPRIRAMLVQRRAKDKNISPEQAEQELNLTQKYWDLAKKVEMGTASDEEKAEFSRLDSDPQVQDVVKDNTQYLRDMSQGLENNRFSHLEVTSQLNENDISISNRTNIISELSQEKVQQPKSVSVARDIDNSCLSNQVLSNDFNVAAQSHENRNQIVQHTPPSPQFSQSVGML